MGAFSFQSSKNVTSGEGGIILTNDRKLHELCWSYHNCGRHMEGAWYEHYLLGGNYRITEFQAAILLVQLERLEEQTKTRNENASYLSKRLSQIEGITPQKRDARVTTHAYHLYIFRYASGKFQGLPRSKFLEALRAEGVPCSPGYLPLYKLPFIESTRVKESQRFHEEEVDYSTLTLPVTEKACYEEGVWFTQRMLLGTKEDMDDIAKAITKIKENVGELL